MNKKNKEASKKLNQLAAGKKSAWVEDYEKRRENRDWLKRSQKVALKILRTLRAEKIDQKELAVRMGVSPQQVSKWVKGKENFTFETISKIEAALNIQLMEILSSTAKQELDKVKLIKMLPQKSNEVNYVVQGEEKKIYLHADETNQWNNKRKYPYS